MFSVIIPVYNGEKFIQKAVDNVIAQTIPDWELIVVNDGSTDQTLKMLEPYENHPKIRIITRENGGVSAARNTGMKHARFSYFAFLDCDDTWLPNHLETFKSMIEQYPDAGIYYTLGLIRLADGKNISNISFFEKRSELNEFVRVDNFIKEYDQDKNVKAHTTCACVSKSAAEKAGGFREGCKIGEDLAFFLNIGIYFPVVLSSKITSVYEKGNSTATKDVSFDPDWFFFEESKEILKDDSLSEDKKKHLRSVMTWFTMRRARHYVINGRKKEAWKSYREIGSDKKIQKDKLITLLLLLLPVFLVRKIFMMRWRNSA